MGIEIIPGSSRELPRIFIAITFAALDSAVLPVLPALTLSLYVLSDFFAIKRFNKGLVFRLSFGFHEGGRAANVGVAICERTG